MKHSELRHQPRHVNPRIQDLVYHRGNINKLEEYFDFAINNNIKKVRLISLMNMGRAVGQMERVPLDEFVDIMYKLIKKKT